MNQYIMHDTAMMYDVAIMRDVNMINYVRSNRLY